MNVSTLQPEGQAPQVLEGNSFSSSPPLPPLHCLPSTTSPPLLPRAKKKWQRRTTRKDEGFEGWCRFSFSFQDPRFYPPIWFPTRSAFFFSLVKFNPEARFLRSLLNRPFLFLSGQIGNLRSILRTGLWHMKGRIAGCFSFSHFDSARRYAKHTDTRKK